MKHYVWLVQKIEQKDTDIFRKIKNKITGNMQKKVEALTQTLCYRKVHMYSVMYCNAAFLSTYPYLLAPHAFHLHLEI